MVAQRSRKPPYRKDIGVRIPGSPPDLPSWPSGLRHPSSKRGNAGSSPADGTKGFMTIEKARWPEGTLVFVDGVRYRVTNGVLQRCILIKCGRKYAYTCPPGRVDEAPRS